MEKLNMCYFSTGICGTLTCSKDKNFDEFGYPMNKCPEFKCKKYLELTAVKVKQ